MRLFIIQENNIYLKDKSFYSLGKILLSNSYDICLKSSIWLTGRQNTIKIFHKKSSSILLFHTWFSSLKILNF